MKAAVRYYTQTGNSKKLADAIADELGIEAKPVTAPLEEKAEILFLVNSVYWAGMNKNVKDFIKASSAQIGTLVNVSTAALIESTYGQAKKIAKESGVRISDREFHCRGRFTALHSGHPDDKDLKAVRRFAKEIVK